MKIEVEHPWDVDFATARQIQTELRNKVILKAPSRFKPRLVCGTDAAYFADEKKVLAATVVLTFPDLEIVEERMSQVPVRFPYRPGLLTFREGPALIKALLKVKSHVDLIFIDGQGIAHPRGLGLASHLGIIMDIPTIGCAKTRLVGNFLALADFRGASSPLVYEGKVVGAVLRTRAKVKPIFVSPGHRMSLEDAIPLVMACSPKYRIPEPVRLAHALVKAAEGRKTARPFVSCFDT